MESADRQGDDMPTTRHRLQRGRVSVEGITEDAYQYFVSGAWFGGEDFERGKSQKELKEFWEKNKQVIMDRCLAENKVRAWVAKRPTAFWDYDMPEPQRKVEKGEYESKRAWDHQRKLFDWVESDFDYLKRLNLLEDWELENNR